MVYRLRLNAGSCIQYQGPFACIIMFDFFDIFKVDPTISDPAVAAASGITRDSKGTIH